MKPAFTLIELIVAIAIIAALSSLLLPLVTDSKRKALDATTTHRINNILSTAQKFRAENGNVTLACKNKHSWAALAISPVCRQSRTCAKSINGLNHLNSLKHGARVTYFGRNGLKMG